MYALETLSRIYPVTINCWPSRLPILSNTAIKVFSSWRENYQSLPGKSYRFVSGFEQSSREGACFAQESQKQNCCFKKLLSIKKNCQKLGVSGDKDNRKLTFNSQFFSPICYNAAIVNTCVVSLSIESLASETRSEKIKREMDYFLFDIRKRQKCMRIHSRYKLRAILKYFNSNKATSAS